ncbi:MAG TPA: PspC domain-containing protein [Bacteroidales bacterium]
MKKTVIVNINGIIFHIDEDAYSKLNAYLDALHKYFDSQTEGKEIVSDIESRIAELLQPLISETKQSVTIEDIDSIIITLGKPEDIAGDENRSEEPKSQKQERTSSHRYGRKLYRDPDNSVLGGVCSGIAAYFDIDPILIRIIFVALFFAGGISILIYPILWIAIPMANTAAQKLEMRGEDVTINNIEREYHAPDSIDPNSFWGRLRSFINSIFHAFGRIFFIFWRVLSFVIGTFLIFISIVIIISLIAAIFFNKFYIDGITATSAISVKEFLTSIIDPAQANVLLIVLLFVILIPLIGMIYGGLKLIIRFKAKDKWAVLSMFLLWIVSIIIASVLVFSQVNNFRIPGYVKDTIAISVPKGNVLYLNTPDTLEPIRNYEIGNPPPGLFGIKIKDNKKELWGIVRFDIEKSLGNSPELEIIREARGPSYDDAMESAKRIKINYTQTDSVLNIDPVFWANEQSWEFQKTRIVLHLPINMKLVMNENVRHYLDNDSYWKNDLVGKKLIMTEEGLKNESDANVTADNRAFSIELNRTFNNRKIDSILSINNNQRYASVNTDSGDYYVGKPSFLFKPWDKDYINVRTISGNPGIKSENLHFNYYLKDNILYLPNFWYYRNNKIKIEPRPILFEVLIPKDSYIYFSREMTDILQSNHQYLVDKTWQITNKGFVEVGKK